jgi:hypothetical protein
MNDNVELLNAINGHDRYLKDLKSDMEHAASYALQPYLTKREQELKELKQIETKLDELGL